MDGGPFSFEQQTAHCGGVLPKPQPALPRQNHKQNQEGEQRSPTKPTKRPKQENSDLQRREGKTCRVERAFKSLPRC